MSSTRWRTKSLLVIIIIIKGHSLRRACLQPATNTQNSKPRPPTTNARSKGKLENKIKHCSKLRPPPSTRPGAVLGPLDSVPPLMAHEPRQHQVFIELELGAQPHLPGGEHICLEGSEDLPC